jgi:hypothetical protein
MEFDSNLIFAIVAVLAVLGFSFFKYFGCCNSHSEKSSHTSSSDEKMMCDGDKCHI